MIRILWNIFALIAIPFVCYTILIEINSIGTGFCVFGLTAMAMTLYGEHLIDAIKKHGNSNSNCS